MTHEIPSTAPEQASTPEIVANFNDEVLVRITEAGEKMWNLAYELVRQYRPEAFPLIRDEEGYTKMQLHDVANIFGPELYNGNPQLPIEPTFKLVRKN